jgi:hypothetical protein
MAKTRKQLISLADALEAEHGPDTSESVFVFPDGRSIRKLATYADAVREGELMSSCISPWSGLNKALDLTEEEYEQGWEVWDLIHEIWHDTPIVFPADEQELMDFAEELPKQIYSLRDPDNIPHLTDDLRSVSGRHNSEPKQKYRERIELWKETRQETSSA